LPEERLTSTSSVNELPPPELAEGGTRKGDLMMPYMYILECADGSYYTGSTWNLEKRLWEHQNGLGAKYTEKRLPVKLVYCEPYDRVEDAYRREKQIQGWSRRKKQALIEGNTENLIEFSKNYTQYGRPEERLAELVEANTGSASASSASASVGEEANPPPELAEGGYPGRRNQSATGKGWF
jgi:putative endonuclease